MFKCGVVVEWVVLLITLSLPTRVEVELGCDNSNSMSYIHKHCSLHSNPKRTITDKVHVRHDSNISSCKLRHALSGHKGVPQQLLSMGHQNYKTCKLDLTSTRNIQGFDQLREQLLLCNTGSDQLRWSKSALLIQNSK